MNEQIRVLVNGYEYEEVNNINHVFGSLFMINFDSYHFMSIENIKHHMQSCIELIKELGKGTKQLSSIKLPAKITKSIKAMQNIIDNVTEKKTILTFITNLILAKEGLGLLSGFGCATSESKGGKTKRKSILKMNPEKQSMVVIKP